jgi:hypothetical protein
MDRYQAAAEGEVAIAAFLRSESVEIAVLPQSKKE